MRSGASLGSCVIRVEPTTEIPQDAVRHAHSKRDGKACVGALPDKNGQVWRLCVEHSQYAAHRRHPALRCGAKGFEGKSNTLAAGQRRGGGLFWHRLEIPGEVRQMKLEPEHGRSRRRAGAAVPHGTSLLTQCGQRPIGGIVEELACGECMHYGGDFLPDLCGHPGDRAERHLDGYAGNRPAEMTSRILRRDRIEVEIRASDRLAPRGRAEEENASEIAACRELGHDAVKRYLERCG